LAQHTKPGKYTKMATKYSKWQRNRQTGHNIYQQLSLQDTPKFTQIGIFGFENLSSGNPGLHQTSFDKSICFGAFRAGPIRRIGPALVRSSHFDILSRSFF
jgi:hypothetical protein